MDIAYCSIDGRAYTALEFQDLPPPDLDVKRRQLACVKCGNQAFFRKKSAAGQTACFGARPHAPHCNMGAADHLRVEAAIGPDEQISDNTDIMVIDLNFGAAPGEIHLDPHGPPAGNARGGSHRLPGGPRNARAHRRLSTLLKHLRTSPHFRNSEQAIEINGEAGGTIRSFFSEFSTLQHHQFDQMGGYWGMISDAAEGDDTTWLNSGGRGDISIGIAGNVRQAFMQRFGVDELEDLAGAYVLVIGKPRTSQYGKKFLIVDDIGLVTASLA